jgi:hypothetical protein
MDGEPFTDSWCIPYGQRLAPPYTPDPTRPVTIYSLCDPDTDTVRYVGLTTRDPEARLRGHLYGARVQRFLSPKDQWLLRLRQQAVYPTVRILARVPLADAVAAETYWCAVYAATITNSALPGGFGCHPKPRQARGHG